jgi:phosphoesterase RecJ-like protein
MVAEIFSSIPDQLLQALHQAKRVIIGTHISPDGDTIGSGLAMSYYLDQIGIPHELVCYHNPPQNLRFLPGIKRVKTALNDNEFDVGLIVDTNALDRLGPMSKYFEDCATLIVIDHHVPHTKPGDIRLIDSTAAATALIITRLFLENKIPITPEMATCLLTGIVTDTGGFRWSNTSVEALNASAKLIELGADINFISDQFFQHRPLAAVRLFGKALELMKTSHQDRLVWVCLSQEAFKSVGAIEEYSEGIANELLSIEKSQIAILFRESEPGRIRISMRSRNGYDVALLAGQFGGGGHQLAAGCTVRTSLAEAEEIVIKAAGQCLESSR